MKQGVGWLRRMVRAMFRAHARMPDRDVRAESGARGDPVRELDRSEIERQREVMGFRTGKSLISWA